MKNNYIKHDEITKELLNSIEGGDLVKCNNWRGTLKVIGVSENYFLMVYKDECSICEKKPSETTRNFYTKGSFRIGTDNYIFGFEDGYKFENEESIKKYLNEFETGVTELSVRNAVDLVSIAIKKSNVTK